MACDISLRMLFIRLRIVCCVFVFAFAFAFNPQLSNASLHEVLE